MIYNWKTSLLRTSIGFIAKIAKNPWKDKWFRKQENLYFRGLKLEEVNIICCLRILWSMNQAIIIGGELEIIRRVQKEMLVTIRWSIRILPKIKKIIKICSWVCRCQLFQVGRTRDKSRVSLENRNRREKIFKVVSYKSC